MYYRTIPLFGNCRDILPPVLTQNKDAKHGRATAQRHRYGQTLTVAGVQDDGIATPSGNRLRKLNGAADGLDLAQGQIDQLFYLVGKRL